MGDSNSDTDVHRIVNKVGVIVWRKDEGVLESETGASCKPRKDALLKYYPGIHHVWSGDDVTGRKITRAGEGYDNNKLGRIAG